MFAYPYILFSHLWKYEREWLEHESIPRYLSKLGWFYILAPHLRPLRQTTRGSKEGGRVSERGRASPPPWAGAGTISLCVKVSRLSTNTATCVNTVP